jgi:hypothetical protein
MTNQTQADEIEQFLANAAKFGTPSGVTVAVELEDGKVMTQTWAEVEATVEAVEAVEATVEATSEPSEPTPETIRDAWTEIATGGGLGGWRRFQSMAAKYGLHRMKRPAMIDKLADMGVMPGDDPPEDTEQSVFNDRRAGGVSSKALATADD